MNSEVDFIIQRFKKGHPLFSNAEITNEDPAKGVVGTFRAVFGQCIDKNGELVSYTMEREDTLIACDIYEFDIIDSPNNKCQVTRLTKDSQGNDISARMLECHPANWVYQLKGCTAHGTMVDVKTPALIQSRVAFSKFMGAVNNIPGKIRYEYFDEVIA